MRQPSGAVGERQHQRRVDAVEEEFDDAVVGVGHDRTQLVAFFYVLATLAHVRRHAVDEPIARGDHVSGFEPLDPVVEVLDITFDREQVLLGLPQVAAGHRDGRETIRVGLEQEGFLREQGRERPLDFGIGLVGVGLGAV